MFYVFSIACISLVRWLPRIYFSLRLNMLYSSQYSTSALKAVIYANLFAAVIETVSLCVDTVLTNQVYQCPNLRQSLSPALVLVLSTAVDMWTTGMFVKPLLRPQLSGQDDSKVPRSAIFGRDCLSVEIAWTELRCNCLWYLPCQCNRLRIQPFWQQPTDYNDRLPLNASRSSDPNLCCSFIKENMTG